MTYEDAEQRRRASLARGACRYNFLKIKTEEVSW